MSASTAGWDTVYAVRIDKLNQLLDKQVASGAVKLPQLEGQTALGHYWSPVQSIHLVGDPAISGTRIRIAIELNYGTIIDNSVSDNDNHGVGLVRIVGTANLERLEDDHQVKIVIAPEDCLRNAIVTGADLPPKWKAIIAAAVSQALSEDPDLLRHVVGVVDLQAPGVAKMPGLSPVEVRHCISGGTLDGDSDKGSILAVVTMTQPFVQGNPVPVATFDGTALTKGNDAAFLLSGRKFTRTVLFPGLANGLFKPPSPFTSDQLRDVEAQHLEVDEAGGAVRIRPGSGWIPIGGATIDLSPMYGIFAGSIALPPSVPFAVLGLIAVAGYQLITTRSLKLEAPMTVNLTDLEVRRTGSRFTIKASVHCQVSIASIDVATVTMTSSTSYDLQIQPDGNFLFVMAGTPTNSDPDVDAPDWLKETGVIAPIVVSIVSAIAMVLTEGTAAALIGIMLGLVEAEILVTPALVAKAIANGGGIAVPAQIGSFFTNAASPMSWFRDLPLKQQSLTVDQDMKVQGTIG